MVNCRAINVVDATRLNTARSPVRLSKIMHVDLSVVDAMDMIILKVVDLLMDQMRTPTPSMTLIQILIN